MNRVVPLLSRDAAPAGNAESPVGAIRSDLRKWCSPIEDQGEIGSCTAHAVVGALEYFERKVRGEHVDASRRFLYRVTRRYLGWEGKGDTGAFLRSAIKALRLFGALPEEYWPYDEREYDAEPEAFHYAFAQNYKALEYFRVPENVHDLQQVLLAGFPFVFGFTCFNSLFAREVVESGVIPYPRRNEKTAGGHAVMAVGHTDSHVIIRNSWGRSWGDDGCGYLPWTYFDSAAPLADDCWVLVNAAWMPHDEGEEFALKARASKTVSVADVASDQPQPAEALRSQIRVARGTDPLAALPLRLGWQKGALVADAPMTVQLAESNQPVSLYLRELTLLDSFDFALFGGAVNELFVMAVCWDLSGAPPVVFPAKLGDTELRTYNMKRGQKLTFVGDGVQLWPSTKIKGALYVCLVVIESDQDVRRLGKKIEEVQDAIQESSLTTALQALAVAGGVAAPLLAAVLPAAQALTAVVANTLQQNGDDLVALFDGSYGVEFVAESRTDRYAQAGAEIDLHFEVAKVPKSTSPRRAPASTKRQARSKRTKK